MKWVGAQIIVLISAVLLVGTAWASEPKPLFADQAPINIRIEAPFKQITSEAKRSTDPHPAKLILQGEQSETHIITLAARGKSRREKNYCRFPPLRVRFGNKESGNKPEKTSLFKGQKNLKLVTHCKSSDKNQQQTLVEYTAYHLLNQMTADSLKVRLAHIDYVEAATGETVVSRTGFFIEDMDDAAKRTGRAEIDRPAIKISQLDGEAGARVALFQYMISNLDWSMTKGPEGADCCHNTKLMAAVSDGTKDIVPVPYDFDQSGFVATDYAEPPANIPVNSVKTRVYRGYCALNTHIPAQAVDYVQKRAEFLSTVNSIPNLQDSRKKRINAYLEKFFETLSDPKKLESRIIKKCRK